MNHSPLSPDLRAYPEDYLRILSRFPRMLLAGWHQLDASRGYFGDSSHDEVGMRAMGSVVFTSALLAIDSGYDETAGGCDRERLLNIQHSTTGSCLHD